MKNFWSTFAEASADEKKIKKPILAMAPMAGYTDSAFRQICKEFGADVLYSEMASATALFYNQKQIVATGQCPVPTLDLLKFSKKERPYVVQLFGNDPKHFEMAVKTISGQQRSNRSNGGWTAVDVPDGIDINFGCPVPKVAKQKAGAELFKDLKRSREVIKACLGNTDLPISIKTRTKAGSLDILKFLDNISDLDVKALMIHGRTLKQGFAGDINTEIIKKVRNYFGGVILANGGIESMEEAKRVLAETEADGLGLGRGALGKPWLFSVIANAVKQPRVKSVKHGIATPSARNDIFRVALKHAKLVDKLKGDSGIIEMRKHLCAYVQGLSDAKKLRSELVKVEDLENIKKILNKFS